MITNRNKLPAKTRYDESVPEGHPRDQWVWLLNEWLSSSFAFARQLKREQDELARAAALRQALGATPSLVRQTELLGVLEEVGLYRAGIIARHYDCAEAAEELLDKQAEIAAKLGSTSSQARLAARQARIESRVALIEKQNSDFYDAFKAEAKAAWEACPDYLSLSGKFFHIAFFIRDHLGGPQPKGWVTVSGEA